MSDGPPALERPDQRHLVRVLEIPADRHFPQLKVLSVGELLAKAIRFTHSDQSVSSLFE